MKIVYLFNSSIPSQNANSLQVVNMCNEISKLIGKVLLITPNTGLKNSISEHYGIKKNFEIIKLKKFKKLPRGINYYLYSIYSIILGLKHNPNIFITRNYFSLFILILLRKKVIFEVHTGLEFEGRFNNFIIKNFKIFNSKKIINLVFITNSIKDFFFKKYKIKPYKYTILSSASDLRFGYPKFKKNQGVFKIGYFGLLNKSRGLEFIFKLSQLDSQNKYFVFGGEKNYVNRKKINIFHKNIYLKQYLPYKKIKKKMSDMDLLILPYEKKVSAGGNYGDIGQFTSPMKLFDYLASSKPIVASSLPVLKEILTDKKNCIFVNDLNIFKWKLAINKISNNSSLRKIISKNNFYLSKKFTYKSRVKKMFKDLNL